MKRLLTILVVLMLLAPCLAPTGGAELSAAPLTFIQMLYQGEFEPVYNQSTADMQAALGSADGLAATWAQLEQSFGAYQQILSDTAQEQSGMAVGTIVCAYKYVDVTFSVVVTSDGLLASLTVAAVTPKAAKSTADQTQFVTEDITLRPGEADATQGILTLPNGDGPFPAVIIMQGSGPLDRNGTVLGITPFRDIAEGLALSGVASIRYDKYSYAHTDLLAADPALLKAFTIAEEYILDAGDALKLLQSDERIGDIYLLGHSLGAMILPRVMQALGADSFAGGILLEGSPLPLWEIQYHQNLAMIPKLEQDQQAEAQAAVDAEAAKLGGVLTLSDTELQSMTFFGVSAYYQKDLMSVDASQTAIGLGKPLLIIQGGKDWQITPADGMDVWQVLLAGQAFAEYRYYLNLNHMLCEMDGEPAGDFSDYQAGSKVSGTLIGDIAAWILN
ncbi:MAG: DUF3887 domain-containing protein [Clostridiales bacterium]|nr:DUF3887 domain-containing protein [Clostridiales bacterium]